MKKLKCHCGAIEADVNVPKNFDKILRCNCSLCKRKGALMSMVKNEDFKIIKGEDKLKIYQFHTRVAKHYFCSNCGIHTHHRSRMTPTKYVVNLSCIEGVKIEDYADAPYFNGRDHPKDAE